MPQPPHTNSPSRRFAFTLLELLVVIAIIAMLVAIGLPSMSAARQKGKISVCLANLRGIATASRVYAADDPQDWGIPAHPLFFRQDPENPTYIGAYEWGGKSGIGRDRFLEPWDNSLSSKYGTRAGFGPATRPLNQLFYPAGFKDNVGPRNASGALADTQLDLPAFRCPADDGPPRGAHARDWIDVPDRSSYDHFGNSYAANLFMISPCLSGVVDGQMDQIRPMFSNSPYLRPLSRVPSASRTIMYEENIGRWAWACENDPCSTHGGAVGVDPGPTKSVRGWHGRDWTYTRSFVDGHAEYQRVYVEGTEKRGYAEHYRLEQLSWYPTVETMVGSSKVTWNSYG